MNLGLIGYSGAAIAYSLFAVLLLVSWRGAFKGGLLSVCVIISALWAGFAALVAYHDGQQESLYQVFEVLRYAAWFLFIFKLFEYGQTKLVDINPLLYRAQYWVAAYLLLLFIVFFTDIDQFFDLAAEGKNALLFTLLLFLPIIGLVLIEQLIRNIDTQRRWASKFLFFGIGTIFAYDFFLYSHAVMFNGLDTYLWQARGYISMIAVPLIALSIARNQDWELELYVSRDVVLYSTTVVGGGIYLLLMSVVGFYLKEFGGTWGGAFQILFLTLTVVLLVLIVFSTQLRARLRVFISKHFYKNRYDYRYEWLGLTQNLACDTEGSERFEGVIKALAKIVDCRAGGLWLANHDGDYQQTAAWLSPILSDLEPKQSEFITLLKNKTYIINLFEKDLEDSLHTLFPQWFKSINKLWLVVPVATHKKILGFITLADPLVVKDINWEDRDLLKAAAKQIANHIEVQLASDELSEAKQFEAFNRLSAFMVHDLKNISAELCLINKNADKHRHDQEFLDDVFDTIANTAADIDRVLNQLRNRQVLPSAKQKISLHSMIEELIVKSVDKKPLVTFEHGVTGDFFVHAEPNRLLSVLKHLCDNAQEATADNGAIIISLSRDADINVISIKDTGVGMTAEFIRDRLFKPFDTTKGNAGMGIGMFESRDFIRSLGGNIVVTSQLGQGTQIDVRIPASK